MVKIVADTTSGLPREMLKSLGIPLIPQIVLLWGRLLPGRYRAGYIHVPAEAQGSTELPKTAAPPPALYHPIFEQALRDGEDVVVVAPSAKVSGTVRSAEVAAQDFPKLKVNVVDTQTIAGNLASLVLQAHEWAHQDTNADAIVNRLNEWIPRGKTLFPGGHPRIFAKRWSHWWRQSSLRRDASDQAILCLRNGQVEPFEQQRTKRRAQARLLEVVEAECPHGTQSHLCVMQAGAAQEADALAAELRSRMNLTYIPVYELPPAIVTHGGPGLLAIGFFVA